MVEPSARIRAFETTDERPIQFMIGKANLGALAVANQRSQSEFLLLNRSRLKSQSILAYVHPLTISSWVALSCLFVQRMGWWPKPEHGYIGYLSPLPAFASMAVPIMFLIDW
jgi:hypothetical protein